MTSWRPLGSSWGALGRQMAGKTAPEALLGGAWAGRKRSWAALGAVLAALGALLGALWAILTGPREAPGKDSGRPFLSFFNGHAEEAGKSSKVFMFY